jgi:hypothetical protein
LGWLLGYGRLIGGLVCVVGRWLGSIFGREAAMSPEEWLALVVLLQRQSAVCVAKEDRKFLGEMINVLTLDEVAVVLPWQRRWILELKRECRL